jgi:hypothetical protein
MRGYSWRFGVSDHVLRVLCQLVALTVMDYRLSNYLDCMDYGLLMAELLLV